MKTLFISFMMFIAMSSVAFAGTDVTPFLDATVTALAAALTVATGVITKFVASWLFGKKKAEESERLQEVINMAIQRGISFAEMKIKAQIADPDSPLKNVTFNSYFIDLVFGYVVSSSKDAFAFFGVDPESTQGKQKIEDMIWSRLNDIVPVPEADSGKISAETGE